PSDQCGDVGGERPRKGSVSAHSRPVSSLHDVFRRRSRATRKEGRVYLFTGRTGGGASTRSWPAHISKPSPQRSTAAADPAASHRDHFLTTATLRIAAPWNRNGRWRGANSATLLS